MMTTTKATTTACVGDFDGGARARRFFSSKVSFVGGIRFEKGEFSKVFVKRAKKKSKNCEEEDEDLKSFVCAYREYANFQKSTICVHRNQLRNATSARACFSLSVSSCVMCV